MQQQEGREGAHHVLGAVREIDDVEHAEDDGEAEAQQRIERAVDQPDQQLPEQRLRGNAEDSNMPLIARRMQERARCARARPWLGQPLRPAGNRHP